MIPIFKKINERLQSNYTIIASCISNRGKVRENNEDNLYFDGKYLEQEHEGLSKTVTIQRKTNNTVYLAVFDGMGGENCGEVASYLAASEFHRCVDQKSDGIGIEKFMESACEQMNDLICSEAENQAARGMGTTAAILAFSKNQVYICNLGDSPIFRIRGGNIEPIYEEHTNRLFLEEQGITRRKPVLTQCLGIPREEMLIQPYITVEALEEGDQYLICSDGLTDMLNIEEIQEILLEDMSSSDCVDKLLSNVLERGARDNTTIILCRIT